MDDSIHAKLVSYLRINREFFAETPPRKHDWRAWVEDGVVDGKVIGDKVYINRNHFAANSIFSRPENQTAIDLLLASG